MITNKKHKKIVAIIIGILIMIAFIGYSIFLLIINPSDVYILTQGEILDIIIKVL